MANEVIELPRQEPSGSMPVTKQDVENLKNQRILLKDFVSSQMIEAKYTDKNSPEYGEGDYGIIPGTKKKTLLKPGAEKLLRLFNLGIRVRLVDKEIDRTNNFAMFIYRAEVYHLRQNVVIAECEGSVNSQEVKYKSRTVWRKSESGASVATTEQTPVCDILNTLMKMAQKRAMIGATILATGASDFFTHDIETSEDAEAIGIKARVDESLKQTAPVAHEPAPLCCGKEMIVSKYVDNKLGHAPFYCLNCKSKKPRNG